MANEQNLLKAENLTSEQLRERARKGGIKSGEVRRKRKAMKEQAELLLSLPIKNPKLKQQIKSLGIKTDDIDNQMALIVSLYQTALKGGKNSVQAFNVIMEMTEEKEKETGKATLEKLDEVLKRLGGVV